MVTVSKKDRLILYFLIALIIGFFPVPVITFCFFDCKFYVTQKTASVLLFFFRQRYNKTLTIFFCLFLLSKTFYSGFSHRRDGVLGENGIQVDNFFESLSGK